MLTIDQSSAESYLAQMQHGVAYIESRLDEAIAIAQVASEVGLSRWHFQRIFRSMTGDTVKAYIRGRRFALAVERLEHTDLRVLDIALLAGYDSQESFARAFRAAFGVTPSEVRKVGPPPGMLGRIRLDQDYLRHLHWGVTLTPEIEDRSEMVLVGLSSRFFGADSDKNNVGSQLVPLWDAFLARMDEVPHRIGTAAYGVVAQCGPKSEELAYLAAVEVDPGGSVAVPPGMRRQILMATTAARFTHRGPAADIDHTVSYAYATWLARSTWRHTSEPDLEIYDADYDPTSGTSRIDYALPVSPR